MAKHSKDRDGHAVIVTKERSDSANALDEMNQAINELNRVAGTPTDEVAAALKRVNEAFRTVNGLLK